jgi:hypothetical protein
MHLPESQAEDFPEKRLPDCPATQRDYFAGALVEGGVAGGVELSLQPVRTNPLRTHASNKRQMFSFISGRFIETRVIAKRKKVTIQPS